MASLWPSSILLVFCLLVSQGYGQFRKSPMESYQEPQGMSLELPCVTDQTNVFCSWLRAGNVIPSLGRYKYNSNSAHGDCSINVHNLTYPEDDAVWECQVPSLPNPSRWPRTKVTVLVKPNPPVMSMHTFGSVSHVVADRTTNVFCESSGGNPFARFEWYLNDLNITSNSSVEYFENDRRVKSKLNYVFSKKDNGQSLMCVAIHPLITQNFSRPLDVHFKPVVSVSQKSYTANDGSSLEVDCSLEANPTTTVLWKPNKDIPEDHYVIRGGKLLINVIDHSMDGIEFQCSAHNNVGSSQTEAVKLNVLYTPKLIETSPKESFQKVKVGNDLKLECRFIGNPKPEIRWNFVDAINAKDHVPKSENGVLLLKNVSYVNEGAYYCEGVNFNSTTNLENIVRSRQFSVDVFGPPQFLMEHETVFGYNSLHTRLEQVFCSDPAPSKIYWLVGEERYDVDPSPHTNSEIREEEALDEAHIKAGRLLPLEGPNSARHSACFSVALIVANTDDSDRRDYKIVVQNSFGTSESVVTLEIHSVFSAAMLISIGMIILIFVVVFTILALLFMRRRSVLAEDIHSSPEKMEKGEKVALEMNN